MTTNYPTELEYMLECGICLNRFEDPRVLPCLHSYCLQCLKSHITSNREPDGAFKCPQCRERCILQGDGAEHFPKNFWVNAMKEVIPKLDDEESNLRKDQSPKCDLHHDLQISWYCKTCSLPACPCCILEKHNNHVTENLSIVEAACKNDLFDVSNLASKRIDFLRKTLADIELNRKKMEDELNKTSQDISNTADRICRLVRQHEATLQDKVKEARNIARKHFAHALEVIETVSDHTSSLKSCADTLHKSSHEEALCAVLQAPINKQQLLHQQEILLPYVLWHLDRDIVEPGKISSSGFMGSIDAKTSTGTSKQEFHTENIIFEAPVCSTRLEYKGNYAVCGIVPIYKSKICVSHSTEQYIWVYADCHLVQKIEIPGISSITGMIELDGKKGKLAIVDHKQCRVHFITLSEHLEVLQHFIKEVPFVPCRISMSYKRDIVVNSLSEKRVAILNPDGQVLSMLELFIPHDKVAIYGVEQTRSGFVVRDKKNSQIYFTDANGNIMHTHTDCKSTLHAVQNSWGHVLVADFRGIKVFSEGGEFLGNVHDNNGTIMDAHYLHVDETERLLYVSCGKVGEGKVRTYKFAPSDLQPLPIMRSLTDMTVNISLINV